jgi:uncharacterized protein
MRIRLDPWPADYEAPIPFEEAGSDLRVPVETGVETSNWAAIPAGRPLVPTACYFVDGVRRVEARVLAEERGALIHGLFGSLASGYVRAADQRAEFGEIHVERLLVLGTKDAKTCTLEIGGHEIHFSAYATDQNSPNGTLAELQSVMRGAEARLAEQLAQDGGCVFVDGPSYRATGRFRVVGVIKRILEPYLPDTHFSLVEQLTRGQRTPLFRIHGKTYERYSCFLRLSEPRPVDHSLAGIVRIEVGAAAGLDTARELATLAASMLPDFASTSMRDPRAPQNLLPIGALESEMRRRMGDTLLLRRAIEEKLHEQRDW